LTRASINLHINLSKRMDCGVKPGNDRNRLLAEPVIGRALRHDFVRLHESYLRHSGMRLGAQAWNPYTPMVVLAPIGPRFARTRWHAPE
jgi:hypothetical protein